MKQNLYEILWQVETDSISFLYREFKIFSSEHRAKHYGKIREKELNEGLAIEEIAQNGYYFKYYDANSVREIDGVKVKLSLKH